MKQKKTRILSLFLAALMLLSLSACGKKEPEPPDATPEGTGQKEPAEMKSPKTINTNLWDLSYDEQDGWVYEEDGVDTGMPAWEKAVIGADVAVGVILIGLGALVWRRYRKSRAEEA